MEPTLRIARPEFTPENLNAILGLIDQAREWLPRKGTDQWQSPWPDQEACKDRIRQGLKDSNTWIAWDGEQPVATTTIAETPNRAVWHDAEGNLDERAVYIHRLITARRSAGWGLGAQLIDWAGLRGRDSGAKWIRIDV